MGGTSTTSQHQEQQSQLTPWAPAASGLERIFGALDPSIATLAGTPLQNLAFGALEANAQAANPYAAPVGSATLAQLAGAPHLDAASRLLTGGYDATAAALSPYTGGAALDPQKNPALAQELATVAQQVQNTVDPLFSAAGRLGSPANAKAIAQGIAQGDTGLLQNAAGNALQAAGLLSGAGTSTAAGLDALDAANAGILGQGIANAPAAYAAQNFGPQALLAAATAQQQLPFNNAGLLSSLYDAPAAQFGTQTGSGTTTGTQTMSPMQQLLMGSQAFANFLSPFRTRSGLSFPSVS